jgi:hypothetical protein
MKGKDIALIAGAGGAALLSYKAYMTAKEQGKTTAQVLEDWGKGLGDSLSGIGTMANNGKTDLLDTLDLSGLTKGLDFSGLKFDLPDVSKIMADAQASIEKAIDNAKGVITSPLNAVNKAGTEIKNKITETGSGIGTSIKEAGKAAATIAVSPATMLGNAIGTATAPIGHVIMAGSPAASSSAIIAADKLIGWAMPDTFRAQALEGAANLKASASTLPAKTQNIVKTASTIKAVASAASPANIPKVVSSVVKTVSSAISSYFRRK